MNVSLRHNEHKSRCTRTSETGVLPSIIAQDDITSRGQAIFSGADWTEKRSIQFGISPNRTWLVLVITAFSFTGKELRYFGKPLPGLPFLPGKPTVGFHRTI
ncbi:MAG: hypothetical protein CMJ81_02025 [Planctomycetaceae bacterium]|nr:hypothetical protein [Planctomycetaceae bacterium]